MLQILALYSMESSLSETAKVCHIFFIELQGGDDSDTVRTGVGCSSKCLGREIVVTFDVPPLEIDVGAFPAMVQIITRNSSTTRLSLVLLIAISYWLNGC